MSREMLEELITQPERAGTVLLGLEDEPIAELWEELNARVQEDENAAYLLFMGLAGELRHLIVRLLEAGCILNESEFPALLWENGASKKAIEELESIPEERGVERAVCAVLYNMLLRNEWPKRNALLEGVQDEVIQNCLTLLLHRNARSLMLGEVDAFAPLFGDELRLEKFTQYIHTYMVPELEILSRRDQCLGAFRSARLEQPGMTFAHKLIGLLVFLCDDGMNYYDDILPILDKLEIEETVFSEFREWLLFGQGEKPLIPIHDMTLLRTTLATIPGLADCLSRMNLTFNPTTEILQGCIDELCAKAKDGQIWGRRLLQLLMASLANNKDSEVLFHVFGMLFSPKYGFEIQCSNWEDLEEAIMNSAVDTSVFFDTVDRSALLNYLWCASKEEHAVLDQLKTGVGSTPSQWITTVLNEVSEHAEGNGLVDVGMLWVAWGGLASVRRNAKDVYLVWVKAAEGDNDYFRSVFMSETSSSGRLYDMLSQADECIAILQNTPWGESPEDLFLDMLDDCRECLNPPPQGMAQEMALDISRLILATQWTGNADADTFFEEVIHLKQPSFLRHMTEGNGVFLGAIDTRSVFKWLDDNREELSGVDGIREKLADDLFRRVTTGEQVAEDAVINVIHQYAAGHLSESDVLECYQVIPEKLRVLYRQFLDGKLTDTNTKLALRKGRIRAGVKKRKFLWRDQIPRAVALLVLVAFLALWRTYFASGQQALTFAGDSVPNQTNTLKTVEQALRDMGLVSTGSARWNIGSYQGLNMRDVKENYPDLTEKEQKELVGRNRLPDYSYWILRGPVENGLMEEFFDDNPDSMRKPAFQRFSDAERHPAVNVPYDQASLFCELLTKSFRARLPELYDGMYSNWVFRLPTEEEWVAACVGDSQDAFWWGAEWKDAPEYIDDLKNRIQTFPVETGRGWTNQLGLTGFHFNVAEWCYSPVRGGVQQEALAEHLVKGAAWPLESEEPWQRTVYMKRKERMGMNGIGFRVVFVSPDAGGDS